MTYLLNSSNISNEQRKILEVIKEIINTNSLNV